MELVVQIQLIPETVMARALRATVERFNEAANWLAGIAFDLQLSNRIELQNIAYHDVRQRFEP
jgi:putative transposase